MSETGELWFITIVLQMSSLEGVWLEVGMGGWSLYNIRRLP